MKNFILILLLIIGASINPVFGAKITSDLLQVGKPGSSADKVIQLGTTRKIRANETTNALEFTNDGVVYKKIGAGEGGSSGGVNDLQNPGFEDGITTNWTSSGDVSQLNKTGCTLGTNCPLVGETSLRFSPDAQNDYFESALFTLSEANYGRSCEARVFYVGGDENLEAQVINGDLEILGKLTLKAHSQPDFESVFFLCPTKAAVVADADKGNLKIKINNTGVSAAASADFDDMYGGNLIGLVETALPDQLSARIQNNGAASIISQSSSFLTSVTRTGAGLVTVDYTALGLSVVPSVNVTAYDSVAAIYCETTSETATSTVVRCQNDGAVLQDADFSFSLTKQGADAKQSVQVYKSIPKVAQNENEFSAKWNDAGLEAGSENVDWITSCTNNSTGNNTCNFVAGTFSVAPNCSCSVENATANINCTIGSTSTQLQTTVFTADTGASISRQVSVVCQKAEADYKTPTVQPILVNQVENSRDSGVRVEACRVQNNGTATIDVNSGLCESWIESVTRTAAGQVDVVYKTGIFSRHPVCVAQATNSNNNHAGLFVENFASRKVSVNHEAIDTLGNTDGPFYIMCTGAR